MLEETEKLLLASGLSQAKRMADKEVARRARWKLINQQKARENRAETARKLKSKRRYKDL